MSLPKWAEFEHDEYQETPNWELLDYKSELAACVAAYRFEIVRLRAELAKERERLNYLIENAIFPGTSTGIYLVVGFDVIPEYEYYGLSDETRQEVRAAIDAAREGGEG